MAKLRGKIANVMKDMCIIIPAKTKVLKFFVALFEEELIWTTNGAEGAMAISMTSFTPSILTYVFTRRPSLITYDFHSRC